ncbi:MAG TPA: ISKra4 family transposase, partial [Candidatus Limnocylindrales bacterium]|nr:ISKra4 family transposase [Candidatus Limnocylindrales bacterium]
MTGRQPAPVDAPASQRAGGLEAFWDLERWLSGAAAERLCLPAVERESERRGRELLRILLQNHIDSRGTGDVGWALECPGPDGPTLLTRKRPHPRRLLTIFGAVSITRTGYAAAGQASIHPLDAELQLPARCYSYEISRRLVRAAISGPFDEAVAIVADTTGVCVPKRSAEQIVLEASVDFESFYALRAATPPAAADILIGAIDGKGIPMVKPQPAAKPVRFTKGQKRNKKRMATVAAVFSQPPDIRTPEAVVDSLFGAPDPDARRTRARRAHAKRVWASLLATKDTFIADVNAEMSRRDPDRTHTWVIVTDGERALQHRVIRTFTDVTLVLDLLHVLEKLWTAAYVFHPEASPEAEQFVRDRTLRILRGQVSGVVQGLRQMATKHHLQGTRRATLLGIAAYLYRNRQRMRYDHYLQNGWPIASGSVEG